MNRSRAKVLTASGIACIVWALALIVAHFTEAFRAPTILLPLLFFGGIVLIVVSLAYYTEK